MLVAALVALAALVGSQLLSADQAGAQTTTGAINGCYKAKAKKKKRKGILRIVPSGKCKKKEKPISWNAQGPSGPRGERGPSGSVDGDAVARITLLEEGLADVLAQIELLQSDIDLLCSADGVGGLIGLVNDIVGLPILGGTLDEFDAIVCSSTE